jgi:hypothetical protein
MLKPIADNLELATATTEFYSLLLNNLLDNNNIWTYVNTIIEIESILNTYNRKLTRILQKVDREENGAHG